MFQHARKTIIALGLAISFVAMTANPANATRYLISGPQGAGVSGIATGGGWIYHDITQYEGDIVETSGRATKYDVNDGQDRFSCTETWVDLDTYPGQHRSPDFYVQCRNGAFGESAIRRAQYSDSNGPPGFGYVYWPSGLESTTLGVVSCRVDYRMGQFRRSLGNIGAANCYGAGVDVESYSGDSVLGLYTADNYDEPGFLDGNLGHLWANQTMQGWADDVLVSDDGRYHAIMESGGNFVIYDTHPTLGNLCWITGTWGSNRVVMQGDGNLVVYSNVSGDALWASNTNGSGGNRLLMQTDGNLVIYRPNGTAAWASNTQWC